MMHLKMANMPVKALLMLFIPAFDDTLARQAISNNTSTFKSIPPQKKAGLESHLGSAELQARCS